MATTTASPQVTPSWELPTCCFYCLSLNPEQDTEIWDKPSRPTALLCPYTGFNKVYQ